MTKRGDLVVEHDYAEVDRYLAELFAPQDAVLDDALVRSDAAGLPQIAVSPILGRFLQVMAYAVQARRILEVGTLGGYSSIWLARALPEDGRLVTIELSPVHADVARTNLAAAGLADRTEVLVGPAVGVLERLCMEEAGPFDLIFIDADKEPYTEYLQGALELARPGTMIVADNVVRRGQVVEPEHEDSRVRGVRRFHAAFAADDRLDAVVFQQVGVKGHDGLGIAVVR